MGWNEEEKRLCASEHWCVMTGRHKFDVDCRCTEIQEQSLIYTLYIQIMARKQKAYSAPVQCFSQQKSCRLIKSNLVWACFRRLCEWGSCCFTLGQLPATHRICTDWPHDLVTATELVGDQPEAYDQEAVSWSQQLQCHHADLTS